MSSRQLSSGLFKKLPPRFMGLVFPLVMSLLMTMVMSLVHVLQASGLNVQALLAWPHAWLMAWLLAYPVVLVVLPLARRITGLLVEKG